jgi:hypothetical protein
MSAHRVRWLGTIGPVLTVADLGAVLLAGLVAGEPAGPLLLAAGVAVLVARAADLHRPRLCLSIVEDLPGLLVAALAATVVLAALGRASATFTALALACLVLAHTVVYAVTHLLRHSGRLRRRVLVVGTGATARRLALTLLARPDLGLRPVGFVGTGADSLLRQARGLPLALLGPIDYLPRAMSETRVDAVVVALEAPAGDQETAAVEGLLAAPADVYAVPAHFPAVVAHARHPRELVADLPVVHLHRHGTWAPIRAGKRLVEVLVATLTLVAVLPVGALLAVLVRIETGGVLVHRARVDEGGRPVMVSRFRTRRARSVVRPGTTFSVAMSGRIRPIGRLLRRTRLDALPEVVSALLRRLRYAGGVAGRGALGSAPAPGPDQPQVDTRQLTR